MGELRRMTQFKDKSAKGGEESARVGLFTYPVLMAADILLYDTDRVPVGDDQRQHLELTRDLAIRFNTRYGETFVVPEAAIPPPAGAPGSWTCRTRTRRCPSRPSRPRARSLLLDDPATIERKIKRAVTDTDTGRRRRALRPGRQAGRVQPARAPGPGDRRHAEDVAGRYTQYGPLKADTAAAVIELSGRSGRATTPWAADPAVGGEGPAARGGAGQDGRLGDPRPGPATPSACWAAAPERTAPRPLRHAARSPVVRQRSASEADRG